MTWITSRLGASVMYAKEGSAATRPAVAFSPSGSARPRARRRASLGRGRVVAAREEETGADARDEERGRAGERAPRRRKGAAGERAAAGPAGVSAVAAPVGGDVIAARAARTSSPALAGRSDGSLASARRTTSSRAEGRPGRTSPVEGGGSKRCAQSVATSVSRGNGTRPVKASKRTQPSE